MGDLKSLLSERRNVPRQEKIGEDFFVSELEKGQTKNTYPHNRGSINRNPVYNENHKKLPPYRNTPTETRSGMSNTAWNWVFTLTEWSLDFIKGFMIVGGIIASNLADFIMGSIGISLIVNTNINTLTFVNGFGFGSILSLGASSIQIYMWSLIQKRGITAKMLLTPKMWKNIPHDIRGFLWTALFLWVIDTVLDVSPTFVLFTPENFLNMMWLYRVLVISVLIIVTLLCGFAEILTSNMRSMLAGRN